MMSDRRVPLLTAKSLPVLMAWTLLLLLTFPTVVSAAPKAAAVPQATASGTGTLLVYCGLIVASSWLGGVLPSLVRLTHTRLQVLISLIGGLMLGVGLLHQLPHAVIVLQEAGVQGALDRSLLWMLGGLTLMFFLLRMFHFHQHDVFEPEGAPGCGHPGHQQHHDHDHDHSHDHDHDAPQLPVAERAAGRHHVHGASWMGIAFGLSLHTLIDGLALASHVQADLLHTTGNWLPGVGTFLGIVLHKPLDSLSITSLMSASGSSPRARQLVNFAYALLCPIGALLFHVGLTSFGGNPGLIVGPALALSAGVFVCIALSDLLPEVEFHSHDKLKLSAALLTGLILSWGIGFLEPEHSHGEPEAPRDHDHSHDHDH